MLENVITLEKLMDLMSYAPAKRFGITQDGEKNNLWDLDAGFTVDSRRFNSMGKATPFEGRKLKGKLIS